MTDLSGNCPECYEYPGDKHHKDCSLGIDRAKPDASPREWTLCSGYSTDHDGMKWFVSRDTEITLEVEKSERIHVIEKSAYDALKARVAKYEQRFAKADDLANELAAANETIKALRHEMRMQGGAVERETQANARIAELEVAYDCLEKVYNMNRDWIADAKEREAKLVAALESSNKTILHLMEEYARGNGLDVGRLTIDFNNGLIKAHKGGA